MREPTIRDDQKEIDAAYGALREGLHLIGYAFERSCSALIFLLEEDRWRSCGPGFDNVEDFVASVRMDDFRTVAEKRKKIVALMKAANPEVSNRKIAAATGVAHTTIDRDVSGTNVPTEDKKTNKNKEGSGTNVPPLSGTEAALKVEKAQETAASRSAKEEQRKIDLERPVNFTLVEGLRHDDFHAGSDTIPDNSVQLVFTDPPYDKDSVQLYEDAARIARRILKPGGSFVAYSGHRHLPAVLTACSRHLEYWWTIAVVHGGGNQLLQKLGIRCGWKPLVWFVKGTRGDIQNVLLDTITGEREKTYHEWQQAESEATYIIKELSSEGGLVVDFFAGSGTSGAAAKRLGRKWIGFEVNAKDAEKASKRIESAQ